MIKYPCDTNFILFSNVGKTTVVKGISLFPSLEDGLCRNNRRDNTFSVCVTSVMHTFLILGDKMPNENSINQRIKDLRISKKIPQKEIADLLGIKVSTYSQMERKGTIPAEKFKLIANYFNVDYAVLLDGDFSKPSPPLNTDVRLLCDIVKKELEK